MSLELLLAATLAAAVPSATTTDIAEAIRVAHVAFARDVGGIPVDPAYSEKVVRQAEGVIRRNEAKFNSPQLFLLVDRNHAEQKVFVAFYNAAERRVTIIGAEKTSTGNSARRGHYETPTGVFENKPANMSFRALGTKNSKGWRGFGAKGSRVWDLGWQPTVGAHGEPVNIRVAVHATDPDRGEQRLGRVDSQGCIRIPARFNKFLDYHGVLDQNYEASPKARYVLLAKRDPLPAAGKYIVVIDSK